VFEWKKERALALKSYKTEHKVQVEPRSSQVKSVKMGKWVLGCVDGGALSEWKKEEIQKSWCRETRADTTVGST